MATRLTSASELAGLVEVLRSDVAGSRPGSLDSVEPAGLAVLAARAYQTITSRALLLNLVPVIAVALALLLAVRQPRRALLPVLPTALAAGWAPLVIALLGRLPGDAGVTLGSLNPLTVVLGALVVAFGTEFGVVLLERFLEERRRGLDPAAAAAVALGGVGRAVGVSALTLAAGFGVLAASGPLPGGIPLIADLGLAVVIELGLAVLAVVAVMLPLAVALETRAPLVRVEAAEAPPSEAPPVRGPTGEPSPVPEPPAAEAGAAVGAPEAGPVTVRTPDTLPPPGSVPPSPGEPPAPRRPSISGRRRPAASRSRGGHLRGGLLPLRLR